MIYFDGLDSIIECEYLNENLSNKVSGCNIFVNPENVKYLVGKIIIINSVEYDYNKYLPTLLDNNCTIISRIKISGFDEDVDFQPYIIRIHPEVLWNGKIADNREFNTLNEILDENLCDFDLSNYTLYFPKIGLNDVNKKIKAVDQENNLTCFGWVLQQVGVNIKKDTPFINLDIFKSGKVIFE